MRLSVHAAALPLLLVLVSPLAAQQVVNGTFDTDLSGWEVGNPVECGPKTPEECFDLWVDTDRQAAPESGAVLLRDFSSSGSINDVRQCIPAVEGQVWSASAWVFLPSSSPPVDGRIRIAAHSSADCSTGYLTRVTGNVVSTTDSWQPTLASGFVMPATTASLLLQIFPNNLDTTVPVTGIFDDVRIGIFFSSFDDALLEDWSASVP